MRKEMQHEQISLFDIELLPYNEAVLSEEPQTIPEAKHISFAKVPDEEFTHIFPNGKEGIPTVNDMLKLLDNSTYRIGRYEFLSDVFECGAIAISNRFDLINRDKREERYLQIVKKYDKESLNLLSDMFAKIFVLLTNQINPYVGFNDYLGELYMRSETSNSKAGQFFTPFCTSKLCAEVNINVEMIEEAVQNDKILTLSEPACGSGGMVLAAADVLYFKHHFNISRNLVVECSDIDSRCVHMTYLQLGLAGIPAVIFRRDTLSMQTWERWETPAYIMQYTRFKDFLSGTGNDWKPNQKS
jgi:type I restriction-modification system DNA methylase subunit